jgi:hypothetical protein
MKLTQEQRDILHKAAVIRGRMAAGKPKKYSPEEIAKRTERLRQIHRKHQERMQQQKPADN